MLAFASPTPDATPVWLVSVENWPTVKSTIGANAAAFAERCGFQPKAGRMQFLPGEAGALVNVLFGVDAGNAPTRDPFGPGRLATLLPEGVYRFANAPQDPDLAALGFLLALYRYDRFKADKGPKPRLVAPDGVDAIRIQRIAEAIAYGRDLINAPALADEDAPELMLDFATLTGAARVALGPDLPPFYTDDDALAGLIAGHAARARDPVWRLPLWRPYDAMIEGTVGDISNSGSGAGMAGSITAALFLRRFVEKARSWAHFDVYAWNPKPRAHGPAGGEIQVARALFELLSERYPKR